MHTIKKLKNKTLAFLLTISLALSFVSGAFGFISRTAAHADSDIEEYPPTAVGISNEHFSNSSGNYPATPTSWTGSALDGGSGKVIAGVVDLSSTYFGTDTGNKAYSLDRYPEYADDKSKPQTIFGTSTKYPGSDEKALMINTKKGAEVAYAYSSGDMSFSPNSFYRISAWVKTGDFAEGTGATIKLTGLNQHCAFLNINTVKNLKDDDGNLVLNESNKYGWVKYTFYVRTSAAYTRTVKLVLGIGDAYNDDEEDPTDITPLPADGYAFFDTVSADRISAHDFVTETDDFNKTNVDNVYSFYGSEGYALAIDLYEPTTFTYNDKDIGTFSNGLEGWQTSTHYDVGDDNAATGAGYPHIYNSESIIDIEDEDANIYKLTQNPWAPLGRAEHSSVLDVDNRHPMIDGVNANILLIRNPEKAAYGIASPEINIDRYKYYRFSVWVKGDNIDGSAGICLLVKGKYNGANNFRILGEYTGLSGDSSDTAHYGWKQHVVYIQGSMLYDYTAKFELWLGSPASKASGVAMFDNVSFDELTYSQYAKMSNADGGNIITTIDVAPDDTGISNGNFNTVGDFEDDKLTFPMPVADWTYITAATSETTGFSKADVNTDNAVHGILPTDTEQFEKIVASGAIPSVSNPGNMAADIQSALVISSVTPTAIGYRSPAISVSSGSAYKITADIAVDNVTDGNGAALVLKTTSGDVISTIQNIKTTNNEYVTYTFYINAQYSGQTLYLEIWLGLGDRNNNNSNLSNGNVYVKRVAVDNWTAADDGSIDAEYAELLTKYKAAIANDSQRNNLKYGVYAFGAPTLDYFDAYSYAQNDEFGVPYQWTLSGANHNYKSGIINADDTKNIEVAGFDPTGMSGNILYIHNLDLSRVTYAYDNTVTFEANKYYRLDIDVRVDIPDEMLNNENRVGAVLKLTGSKAAEFSNIKDTTTLIAEKDENSRDRTTFKTYSFYIASGEQGGDIGLEITFGGSDRSSYVQGKLFVKNIMLTEIDNLIYEDAENDTENEYVRAVTLSEAAEDPDDPDADDTNNTDETETKDPESGEIQWWLIPTVIFSTALLAVIIIICVIKLREYVQKRRKKKIVYSTEYDRSHTLRDIERLQKQADNDAEANGKVPGLDAVNDELDDEPTVAEAPETPTEPETTEAPADEAPAEAPAEKPNTTDDLDD